MKNKNNVDLHHGMMVGDSHPVHPSSRFTINEIVMYIYKNDEWFHKNHLSAIICHLPYLIVLSNTND